NGTKLYEEEVSYYLVRGKKEKREAARKPETHNGLFCPKSLSGHSLLDHILGKDEDDTSSSTKTPPDAEWLKIDTIILSWIFVTMSKTLQQRLVENPQSAKEAWDILTDIFHGNKHTGTIALNVELRSLKLRDLTIDAYFCKIKLIAMVLTSLGSPMNSDDVVTFPLEGLPAMYDNISTIIAHREPFLDLKIIRSMLTMK
nr:hybrid signal transduction histidine kinase M [Tanacetum cinerariifolium]